MKKYQNTVAAVASLSVSFAARAQDSIFTKWNGVVIGKVSEVSIGLVKYKSMDNLNGPDYVIRKKDVEKIRFENGTMLNLVNEKFNKGKNEEQRIEKQKSTLDYSGTGIETTDYKTKAFKYDLMSLAFGDLDFAYEQMWRPGFNLEGNLGIIGVGITPDAGKSNGYFVKGGIKFLLGKELFTKGTHYGHPLKGKYVKLEMAYTSFDRKDVSFYTQDSSSYSGSYGFYNPSYTTGKTDIHTDAFAVNIIYGWQTVIQNTVSFEWFAGLGLETTKRTFSNASANEANISYNPYGTGDTGNSNYHSFLSGNEQYFPVSLTAGLKIGYLIK